VPHPSRGFCEKPAVSDAEGVGSDTADSIFGPFRYVNIPTPALRKVREERGTRGSGLGKEITTRSKGGPPARRTLLFAVTYSSLFYETEPSWSKPMRIASTGRAIFAVTMIGLGIIGVVRRDFVPLWNPAPHVPAGGLLVFLVSLISLAAGVGLLIQRMAGAAARLLVATFFLWLLFRLPNFFLLPAFAACWSVFPLTVMLAAALVLYASFASEWDRDHFGFAVGSNGLRIARALYGLSLIFFGSAHFIDVKDTVSLIPNWLPGHLFWAYFTGCAFIAAGIAALTSVCARLAVTLSVLQITLFLVLVWLRKQAPAGPSRSRRVAFHQPADQAPASS
jgi:uncharacterized membrane protein